MKVGVGGVPSTHSRGRRRQRRARGAGVRGDGGAHWAQRRRLRRLGRKPVLPRCPGGGASRWGGRTGSETASVRARRPAGSLKRLSGAGRQGRRRREEPARASDLIRAAANHILHVRGGRAVHGVHSLLHGRPLDPLIFVARVAGQDGAADGARASRGGSCGTLGRRAIPPAGSAPRRQRARPRPAPRAGRARCATRPLGRTRNRVEPELWRLPASLSLHRTTVGTVREPHAATRCAELVEVCRRPGEAPQRAGGTAVLRSEQPGVARRQPPLRCSALR